MAHCIEPPPELLEGEGLTDDAIFEGCYTCPSTTDPSCPFTCTSLQECDACGCYVIDEEGGPWGDAMDVIMCLLPIVFLLGGTLKPNPLPTTVSLPCAAMMMFLIRLMYLGSDPVLTCGAIISGFHEALSPLTIMFGAMLLFETMEATLCMPYMMREMKELTQGHLVAELMLIFGFAYMIEGASGFGTPVALGAPMLASLGHDKFGSVVTLLVMNTFATVWGAAGTPIWFGFGNLGLTDDDFVEISFKGGVCLTIAAFLVMPTLVLTILCPFKVMKQNAIFLVCSLSSVMFVVLGLSFVTFEFPALIGGMLGSVITAGLIRFKVGMKEYIPEAGERHPMAVSTVSENNSIVASFIRQQAESLAKSKAESLAKSNAESLANSVGETKSLTKSVNDDDEEEPNGTPISHNTSSTVSFHNEEKKEEWQPEHSDGNGFAASAISMVEEWQPEEITKGVKESAASLASHQAITNALGPRKTYAEGYIRELFARTFPLWGTVLLLILTRIQQIGLKGLLTKRDPYFQIDFGTYGIFRLSASLVFQLLDILTHPDLSWKYELLYVPFIIPFVLIAIITMIMFRKDLQSSPKSIFGLCAGRLKKPAIALLGALSLVQLMIKEGPAAPADIIGTVLSQALKGGWIAFTALIGTLGSFFSGSTTISNLTFGGIQEIAANSIGTSVTSMLALQATGASAGNGVCLNNIISACTVVGLNVSEGKIIGKTWKPVLAIDVLATLVMLAFFFRF